MSARQTTTEQQETWAEVQDVVDALGRVLVQVQQEAQAGPVRPGAIDALFRDAHTLKGLYGLLGGQARLASAHAAEDLLDAMRMGRQATDGEALELLFACVEAFAEDARLAGRDEARTQAQFAELLARLGRPRGAPAAKATSATAVPPELAGLLTAYEAHRFAEVVRLGLPVVVVTVDLPLVSCEAQLKDVQARLGEFGEVLTLMPSSQPVAAGGAEPCLRFAVYLATTTAAATLGHVMAQVVGEGGAAAVPVAQSAAVAAADRGREGPAGLSTPEVLHGAKVAEASPLARTALAGMKQDPATAPLAEAPAPNPRAADLPPPGGGDAPLAQTVRVDIRRLDKLMHWVNELSLTKIALHELGAALRREQGFVGLAVDLQRESFILERRLADLQAGVMAVRMVPLAQLFERLVRSGHQVAHELGKEVRFVVRGEATEVDKFVAEKLVEPMLHLLRNAVDHAIEYPAERRRRGKEAWGTVQLEAKTRGSQVLVQVRDDGQGIDRGRVLQLAVARGLLGEAQAAAAKDPDIFRLMCSPGFSTRQEVGAISGRGVGLDVVKTQLERMGGSMEIGSEAGAGSTFALSAPLTLAIIPALVLAAANEQYAVPVTHVVESVALDPSTLMVAHGQPMLRGDGPPIPMVYLAAHLGICAPEVASASAQYALVLASGSDRVALAIDDLVGQQDIVVKGLGPRLRQARAFAGAAELASRRVVLVVDGPALVHEVLHHHAAHHGKAAANAAATGEPS